MKVSVSLPEQDVAFLESYARSHGYPSRSAVLRRAVGLLRAAELGDAYDAAWKEWVRTGEAALWEVASSDGVNP